MTRLKEAAHHASVAKAVYVSALRQVDSILRAEVSRDPATLAEAQAIQQGYRDDLPCDALAPNEQPATETEGVVARVVKTFKGRK